MSLFTRCSCIYPSCEFIDIYIPRFRLEGQGYVFIWRRQSRWQLRIMVLRAFSPGVDYSQSPYTEQ
jgi:hypothetical protein